MNLGVGIQISPGAPNPRLALNISPLERQSILSNYGPTSFYTPMIRDRRREWFKKHRVFASAWNIYRLACDRRNFGGSLAAKETLDSSPPGERFPSVNCCGNTQFAYLQSRA